MTLYHYHIRKNGGTTVNLSFLSSNSDGKELYSKCVNSIDQIYNK